MSVGAKGILRVELRKGNDHEEARDDQHEDRDAQVGNIESLVGGLGAPALRVEEHTSDKRPQRPTEPVERLGQIDAGSGKLFIPENRGVGIGDGLKESQSHGHDADAEEEGPELGDVGRRDKPETAEGNQQETDDDASAVAELLGDPSRGKGDQEIAEVVRELDPGRLRTGQVQQILKVLVHGVDHGVAEGPEEKEGRYQGKSAEVVPAVGRTEHGKKFCHGGVFLVMSL